MLQGAGMAMLALLAFRTFVPPRHEEVRTRDVAQALGRVTRGEIASIDLRVDSLPGTVERDWTRAAREAGVVTRWVVEESLPQIAAIVEPTGDPLSPARTTVHAPPGASLRDTAGEVWRSDSSGSAVLDGVVAGGWRLVTSQGVAVPQLPRVSPARRVRVTGAVGWEARFIAVALSEAGWNVESDYTVNPGTEAVRVRSRGALARLDTATHGALVIVGGAATVPPVLPPDIAGWLAKGGGLVLVGGATAPGLDAMVPATTGPRLPGSLGGVNTATPRDGLDALRLAPRGDAVVIERRGNAPVVAARREQLGRVVSVGYLDTWHWRMEGGESALEAHAAWWSSIVASASRPPAMSAAASMADPSPLAALHATLGPPVAIGGRPALPRVNDRWLLATAFALLLAAWGSRRTRGLP